MIRSIKLIALIVLLAIIDILVLSQKILEVNFKGGNKFETSLGIMILLFSFLFLIGGIYFLYVKPLKNLKDKKVDTKEETLKVLQMHKDNEILKSDVNFILDQETRIKKKKQNLYNTLLQRFDVNELTYKKFISVIGNVEDLFYTNIKNVVNKINTFDVKEYKSIIDNDTSRFSYSVLNEKKEIYNGYLSFVKDAININEEILIDLDKLLLEITNLDNVDINNVDDIECVKEMNTLINQTKHYK